MSILIDTIRVADFIWGGSILEMGARLPLSTSPICPVPRDSCLSLAFTGYCIGIVLIYRSHMTIDTRHIRPIALVSYVLCKKLYNYVFTYIIADNSNNILYSIACKTN